EGKTEKYTVRGRGDWKIVKKEEGDWVKLFPDEGKDDGIFEIEVTQNTGFQSRVMNLAFVVNGEEQPVLFRIEQGPDVPRLAAPEKVMAQSTGGIVEVILDTNVENWVYTLSDDSWLTETSKTATKLTFTAESNQGPNRATTLSISSPDQPHLSATVTVEQLSGTILIDEDFSWLAYGNAIPYETDGETRYDNWTPEQRARGWTSTVNTV